MKLEGEASRESRRKHYELTVWGWKVKQLMSVFSIRLTFADLNGLMEDLIYWQCWMDQARNSGKV